MKPTFNNYRGRVVEVVEHLLECPLVVARDQVVALELLVLLRQLDVAQIWVLDKPERFRPRLTIKVQSLLPKKLVETLLCLLTTLRYKIF